MSVTPTDDIAVLDFSVRTYFVLRNEGIITIGDLLKADLTRIRNLGVRSKDEIDNCLRGISTNEPEYYI